VRGYYYTVGGSGDAGGLGEGVNGSVNGQHRNQNGLPVGL
jgi:hypothetical protein